MILDKVKPETREDSNIFSFAGRVALVGGSAVGIYKTLEESKKIEEAKRLAIPVLDKSKTNIVQKIMKDHYQSILKNYESDIEKMIYKDKYDPSFGTSLKAAIEKDYETGAPKSKYLGLGVGGEKEFKTFLKKVKNTVGTHQYDFDRNMPSYIKSMKEKFANLNHITYTEDAGDIISINFGFDTPGENGSVNQKWVSVNPRSKSGFIKTYSEAGDAHYSMAGGILTGLDNGKQKFESSGSYVLKKILENSDDFKNNNLDVNAIKDTAKKAAVFGGYADEYERIYDNRYYDKGGSLLTNKQIIQKSRYIVDPSITGDARDVLESFSRDMGHGVGGEKSLAKGVFVGPDIYRSAETKFNPIERLSPMHERVGLSESITGQSLYRDTVVHSFNGPSIPDELLTKQSVDGSLKTVHRAGDLVRANVLTIAPEMQKEFLETAKLYGSTIHHLPDEEMIYNNQYKGIVKDSFRSQKVLMAESEQVSPLMKMVLDEARKNIGDTATLDDVFSRASKTGGLKLDKMPTLEAMKDEALKTLVKEKKDILDQLSVKKNDVISSTGNYLKAQREAKEQLRSSGKGNAELDSNKNKIGLKAEDYPDDIKAKISELRDLRKQASKIKKEYGSKRRDITQALKILGVDKNGRTVGVNNAIAGNSVTQLFWDSNKKTMRLGLTRTREFGNGLKIHGLKAVMSDSLDIPTILAHMSFNASGSQVSDVTSKSFKKLVNNYRDLGITQVSFADPIASLKKADKFSRMASNTVDAITMNFLDLPEASRPAGMADIFKKHGLIDGTKGRGGGDYRSFMKDLGSFILDGEGTYDEQIGAALGFAKKDIRLNSNKAIGTLTSHVVGIEKHVEDMGAGKAGTLSARGLLNLSSHGLMDTMSDLYGRRMDRGLPLLQSLLANKAMNMVDSSKVAGVSIERFADGDMMDELFDRKSQDVLGKRNMFLSKNFGEELVDGNLVMNLGEKFGNKKVVIYGNKALNDFIGRGVGGKGLTKLDRATEALVRNAKFAKEVNKDLYKRWQLAHQEMVESIANNVFKGKVSGSMYGQINSLKLGDGEGLESMTESMARKLKMTKDEFRKTYGSNVVFMHESDIERQFGKKAISKARGGELYGVFSREPNESTFSTSPVAIMSAEKANPSMAKHANTKRIYLDENDAILKAMFGDTDGDMATVIATSNKEMSDFVQGKTVKGAAFRAVQEELANAAKMIKGQSKGNVLGDLIMSKEERIAYNQMIVEVGKNKIGIVSNEISKIHNALRTELMSSDLTADAAKSVYRAEAASHFFVENILKAKYMSKDEIMNGKADRVLSMVMGSNAYTESKNATKAQRMIALRDFFEQMAFGDSGAMRQLSRMSQASGDLEIMLTDAMSNDQLRILKTGELKQVNEMLAAAMSGEGSSNELKNVSKLLSDAIADTGKGFNDIKSTITPMASVLSDATISKVIDAADKGKTLGKTSDVVGDMIHLAATYSEKGTLDGEMANAFRRASGASLIETAKALGKNIATFGILPAAALGFVSAITDSPKNIQIEESKRQQVKRNNSGYFMQGSKYRSEIIGAVNGSDQFYSDFGRARENNSFNGGSFRLVDHTSNMDPFEIQEVVSNNFF